MRCTIDRLNFTKAVDFVSQFTLKTSAKPVLECVKLVIDRDSLTVSGYDGEAQAEYVLSCESRLTSQVVVNATLLKKIIKACDMDELTIEVEGNRDNPTGLVVKNHDDKFVVPNFGSDLPSLPSVGHDYLTLPAYYLSRAGALTVAADSGSGRYQLQSVLFKSTDSSLELVSTDSRRLMHYHIPFENDVQGSWMIPSTVVKLKCHSNANEKTVMQISLSPLTVRWCEK
jgi:DNA polymerase III sliding clamp (beta) subunit (PCNA family)